MLVRLKRPIEASSQCSSGLPEAPSAPLSQTEKERRSKLERDLTRLTGRAIADFGMIADGDRILVAMSGGKDSYVMMRVLTLLRDRAPVKFELVGVNVDQGYTGYRSDVVEDWLEANGYEHHVEPTDTNEAVAEILQNDGTACSLCARIRRGVLYRLAGDLRCNKIALGHHSDDVIETLMLNLFFAGELKAMPLKLTSDDGKNTVIRPLGYCREEDIREFARLEAFPIIGCGCVHCGDTALQRQRIKAMLAGLEQEHPGVKASMLTALGTVKPSHLLDQKLMAKVGDDRGWR